MSDTAMLRKSLREETKAIKDYKDRASRAEAPSVKKELTRIGKDEGEHAASEKSLLKKASFFDTVKGLMKEPAFVATLAAPVVGAAIGGAADLRRNLHAAKQKTESYRTMMDLHPKLRQHDQKEIGRIFNSLHNINPTLARDPLIAGAWIDNIMDRQTELGMEASHQALLSSVKDLAGIRSSLSQAIKSERSDNRGGERAESLVRELGKQYGDVKRNGIGVAEERTLKHIEEQTTQAKQRLTDMVAKENDRLHKWETQLQGYAQDLHSQEKKSGLDDLFTALDL